MTLQTNYGLDRIEVKDNGSGISKENTACMALPHYTSKISDFSDLGKLSSLAGRLSHSCTQVS